MRAATAFFVTLALCGSCSVGGADKRPLPDPPPRAEVRAGEGKQSTQRLQTERTPVPSPVAISGNGGGSGRGPHSPTTARTGAEEVGSVGEPGTRDQGPRTGDRSSRFFFSGDGRLRMTHAHFNTTLDVQYRNADGTYDPQALAQIRHFFRSREDNREGPVSLRLVELLDYVEDHYHPRSMVLVSAYRSPQFNENLRAQGGGQASTSLHTQGLAADVSLDGLDTKRVWIDLRERRAAGVGYYRKNNFLHIDTGAPRFWEETTSRVSENLSADNARMFVRTDFDRYDSLDGALVDVHSITTFPVRVAPQGRITNGASSTVVQIEPVLGTAGDLNDGCFTIAEPADVYRFRIVDGSTAPKKGEARSTVVLSTCTPRVGKTPSEIISNPIAVGF